MVSVTTMGEDSVLGQNVRQGSRARLKRPGKFSRESDPRLGPARSVSGRVENGAGEELQLSKPGNHQRERERAGGRKRKQVLKH